MNDLKQIRERGGFTQTEAAIAVGVSVEAYRRWESGGGQPTPENLKKLKEVLKIEE